MAIKISKEWLQENYIDKNLSVQECAKKRKCHPDTILRRAKKYGLKKKDENGQYVDKKLFKKNRLGVKISEEQKNKTSKSQLYRKEVLQFTKKGKTPIAEFDSISEAARSNPEFSRESIRRCCQGKTTHHKGYRWEYKVYKGEEVMHRRNCIDFTEEGINDLSKGATNYPKEDRIEHFNRKTKQAFRKIELCS